MIDEEREAIAGENGNVVDLEAERRKRKVFDVKGPEHIFAPLPPEEHLVGGLLRKSSLLLLGGYGSSGKTWMALDLLIAVGLGETWLGRLSCTKGKAMLIDYESGDRETRRRLQALARARGHESVDGIGIACMPNGYLIQPEFESELIKLAKHSDLIVIDSLKAASPGSDENDSKIREGLDMLRRVGELYACAFVVLVHSKKKGDGGGDEREQLRGSSGIFDAADAVLVSTWDKASSRFELAQTKARQGKALDPFRVALVDADGGTKLESEDAPESVGSSEAFEVVVEKVRRAISRTPNMGTNALRAEVRAKRDRVDGAIEYLINNGYVTDNGKNGQHKYVLHGQK
jgi:hypothetical protein